MPLSVHLLALAGFTILTFFFTYPIPLRLFTEVPGGGDAWQHIWNLWWVKEALVNLQTNPYHTNLLYYPQGVNLYLHTLVLTAGLTSLPLQLVGFNLIATYNLILLSTFVLSGYAMFLLCHYLTGNRWASFVGGLVFAFSPYHFAHMFGHMNLASLQWMPFYVLLLLKTLDSRGAGGMGQEAWGRRQWAPGIRNPGLLYAVGAGALLAVNVYTDWLYGIFLALLTGLLVGWRALAPSERRHMRETGLSWTEGLARLVVLGGVAFVLVAPIFFPTLAEAQQGYAQQPPRETLVYSSDAVLAFMPSELNPIWGSAIKQQVDSMGQYLPIKNPSERVVFLGYTVLLLSGFAAWRLRKDRRVRFWAFAAAATWLLSLGPVLQLFGRTQFTAFGISIPMPYLLLYKLPLLSIMRTPSRLTALTMLALGILAAFAMSGLLSWLAQRGGLRAPWRSNWKYVGAALGFPALILFEFLAVPFPTVPPGWNVPIYRQIAGEPGNFALLELPVRPFGDYMAYQTIHGKPIIGGYLSRQPPYPLLDQVPALKYLQDTTDPDDPIKSQITGGEGARQLRDLNVKYIIIHWWAFTPEQKTAMRAKLNALLARPPDFSYPQDQVDVWQLK